MPPLLTGNSACHVRVRSVGVRTALALVIVSGCGRIGIEPLADATIVPDAAPVACTVDGAECDDGNICTATSTCISGTCASAGTTSCVVARSDTEFEDTQGQRGWFYGFYNASTDTDGVYQPTTDFELAAYFDGLWRPPSWEATGANFTWAYHAAWGGHPGSFPQRRATIRRWVSDVAGAATALVAMSKADIGGGDGVRGLLYVDGALVFDRSIAGTDGDGFTQPIAIDLAVGSTVDLLLDPIGSDSVDTTTLSMIVQSR
jgi:hypothetical protein